MCQKTNWITTRLQGSQRRRLEWRYLMSQPFCACYQVKFSCLNIYNITIFCVPTFNFDKKTVACHLLWQLTNTSTLVARHFNFYYYLGVPSFSPFTAKQWAVSPALANGWWLSCKPFCNNFLCSALSKRQYGNAQKNTFGKNISLSKENKYKGERLYIFFFNFSNTLTCQEMCPSQAWLQLRPWRRLKEKHQGCSTLAS